jgi:hypothetical protein
MPPLRFSPRACVLLRLPQSPAVLAHPCHPFFRAPPPFFLRTPWRPAPTPSRRHDEPPIKAASIPHGAPHGGVIGLGGEPAWPWRHSPWKEHCGPRLAAGLCAAIEPRTRPATVPPTPTLALYVWLPSRRHAWHTPPLGAGQSRRLPPSICRPFKWAPFNRRAWPGWHLPSSMPFQALRWRNDPTANRAGVTAHLCRRAGNATRCVAAWTAHLVCEGRKLSALATLDGPGCRGLSAAPDTTVPGWRKKIHVRRLPHEFSSPLPPWEFALLLDRPQPYPRHLDVSGVSALPAAWMRCGWCSLPCLSRAEACSRGPAPFSHL